MEKVELKQPRKRCHFTDAVIRNLESDLVRQVDYWDEKMPGFGIRVNPRGTKSWVCIYRAKDPKTGRIRLRRFTFGRYPGMPLVEARRRAKEIQANVSWERSDPLTQLQTARRIESASDSFGSLSERYLSEYARPKKRTWREDERILTRELLPYWRDFKAAVITRREAKELLLKIVDRGSPIQANRTLALARKIFNFGMEEEIVESNPFWKIRAPGKETKKERFLSDSEIKGLWAALEGESALASSYFKLLLLTGQRPGEVFDVLWGEIDLAEGWWTIPARKAKNSSTHRVPLSKLAVSILRALRLQSGGSDRVFPGVSGNSQPYRRSFRRIKQVSQLSFAPHDLRRTCATGLASLGVSRFIIARILNHKETQITAVYDRFSYDKEKAEAMKLWAKHVAGIVVVDGEAALVTDESGTFESAEVIYA